MNPSTQRLALAATSNRFLFRPIFFLLCVLCVLCGGLQNSFAADPSSYSVVNADRFQLAKLVLCQLDPIQEALKLTDVEKKEQAKILAQFRKKMRGLRQPNSGGISPEAVFALQAKAETALVGTLDPAQRERLDQIQLQLLGPAAFALADFSQRLGLSADQFVAVQPLAERARAETEKAARIPLPFQAGDSSITAEALRELVRSENFVAAQQRAWKLIFDQRAALLSQIEKVLNEKQLADYRKLLGQPFDTAKFLHTLARDDNPDSTARGVGRALGLGKGQRADPNFETKVAHPAYESKHPAVLFDEAHHNFHTATGRYKAFADLIASDGYRVTSNQKKFTPALLADYQVLVIANALGAEWAGGVEEQSPAFTAEEIQAVDDWVAGGGSLLLITDHPPFGAAADLLSRRFGVEMSKGVATDPANEVDNVLSFARDKGQLGDRPILNGRDASERVNQVLTFTGQSLKGLAGSTALLKFSDSAVDQNDDGEIISAAGRAQGVALRHGKGRVVVMGEAAELSAQLIAFPPIAIGMNVPDCDNRQMALNILHWLSGLME